MKASNTHRDVVGSECVFTIIMFPVVALHLLPLFFCSIYWVLFMLKHFMFMVPCILVILVF